MARNPTLAKRPQSAAMTHAKPAQASARQLVLRSVRVVTLRGARRQWLQLSALAALLRLSASHCTPVGAVNRGAQAAAGSSADSAAADDQLDRAADQVAQSAAADSNFPAAGGGTGGGGRPASADDGSAPSTAAMGGARAQAGRSATQTGAAGRGNAGASGASGAEASGGAGGSAQAGVGSAGAHHASGAGGAAGKQNDGGASEPAAGEGWNCMQAGPSCTCVQVGVGGPSDSCTTPKPTCCFELVLLGTNACTCWPADSEECKTQSSEVPDATKTATCPPQR